MSADDITQCDDYSRFVLHAVEHLERQQRRIRRVLREHDRHAWNAKGNTLTLQFRHFPLLCSSVALVGRYESERSQWRWGWSERELAPELTEALEDVRAVGESRGYAQLTREVWTARKDEAWQMASVAALVLDGRGVYRVEEGAQQSYYLLLDPLAFESVPPPADSEW
jgi:hypothetical protein